MTMWAAKVEDDSMKPVIKTGDIVFYSDEQQPKSGEICRVIKKENGKLHYKLRRVHFLKNGKVLLHSDNYTKYPPESLTYEEIHSIRPVVRPLHQYRPPRFYPVLP